MVSNRKTLSVRKQCDLLSVSRSSLYYRPVGETPENLKMMKIMDRHLMKYPTEGVMSMVYMFKQMGYRVNPKRIRRLFRLMGHETLYRRKNLTKAGLREYIRPYLLRGLDIRRPNQVWCTDITYVPMERGFMYLTAIIDVYSRKILSWSISNTMSKAWCVSVLKDAIDKYGKPEIVNTDQGSQYTSALWTHYLKEQKIQISMDGKGRATDNTWIERFWKTIKYNYLYLNPSDNGLELHQSVKEYVEYYNRKVHHTTVQTPNDRYNNTGLKQVA